MIGSRRDLSPVIDDAPSIDNASGDIGGALGDSERVWRVGNGSVGVALAELGGVDMITR